MSDAAGILPKDVLTWCFTIAALVFGVFGFLYATYASASFDVDPNTPLRPPIVRYLRRFCRAIATILTVLTALSAVISWRAAAGWETWIIVLCFVVLTGFSLNLIRKME